MDNRADIYSLGVVIYEMLTGELPGKNFEPPSNKTGVDSRLDEVVHRAMEHDPGQRYQQASFLKTEVERITGAPAGPVPPPVSQAASFATPASGGIKTSVETPAIAMMVVSGLSLCGHLFVVLMGLLFLLGGAGFVRSWMPGFMVPGQGAFGVLLLALGLGWIIVMTTVHVVSLVGANRMRKLESYNWAFASAVILTAGGVLSLPGLFTSPLDGLMILGQLGAGIWGLVVLLREPVKSLFNNGETSPLGITNLAGPVKSTLGISNLKIPAVGLMAASGINLVILLLTAALAFLKIDGPAIFVVSALVFLFGSFSVVTFIGAWKMFHRQNHVLSVVGAALALLTPPGFFLGFAFAVWALILLLFDANTKASFKREGDEAGSKPSRKEWMVAAGIVATAAVLLFGIPVMALFSRSARGSRMIHHEVGNPVVAVPFAPFPQMPELPEIPAVFPPTPGLMDTTGSAEQIGDDDVAARLDVSSRISDAAVRTQTLAAIARDAASAGNVWVAGAAIKRIREAGLHDETCQWAALQLCDRGQRKDAVEIALLIRDPAKRDQTLAELSTRKSPAKEPATDR
ncbi:hypothetical protein JIN84_01365 [Luteolibacter yonseiensis]|uniref:Protein kinase domain-containing protein n=1 Tax=Luteolibacter yonseiensis TaxID=1144680 RepID=A0A934QZT5_9BACT|nr:hypothetical protein [Luteolibacter yonseiensis]MBK1814256.1 hypothetical protein [Luteolibacter yonseiensis]